MSCCGAGAGAGAGAAVGAAVACVDVDADADAMTDSVDGVRTEGGVQVESFELMAKLPCCTQPHRTTFVCETGVFTILDLDHLAQKGLEPDMRHPEVIAPPLENVRVRVPDRPMKTPQVLRTTFSGMRLHYGVLQTRVSKAGAWMPLVDCMSAETRPQSLGVGAGPSTPLAPTKDLYKVVYLRKKGMENTFSVSNTVALLTLRASVGLTRFFHPDTGRQLVDMEEVDRQKHITLDSAMVVSVRFVADTVSGITGAVDGYKSGEWELQSQLAVHNQLTFKYEIGVPVGAKDAGTQGLNGCCKGIHAFTTQVAAMQYAVAMAVTSTRTEDKPRQQTNTYPSTNHLVLSQADIVTTDVTGADLNDDRIIPWWPFGREFTPTEKCPCCSVLLQHSRGWRLMDCGHVVCKYCKGRVAEAKQCPLCELRVNRMMDMETLPW